MGMDMTKYAIIYNCTGTYSIFWKQFHDSAEKYFLPDAQKDYYVFTEDKEILEGKQAHVYPCYAKKMGWPYDVLQKWVRICGLQDILTKYDYLILLNANMQFLRPIPSAAFEGADFTLWTATAEGDDPEQMPFERREASTAYIPYGTKAEKYLSSRFIVGRTEPFLRMSRDLRDRTEADLRNGIIALWHDESMENAFFYHYGEEYTLRYVGPELIAIEELLKEGETTSAIFCNKDKYGGNVGVRYNMTLGRLDILRRKVLHKLHLMK